MMVMVLTYSSICFTTCTCIYSVNLAMLMCNSRMFSTADTFLYSYFALLYSACHTYCYFCLFSALSVYLCCCRLCRQMLMILGSAYSEYSVPVTSAALGLSLFLNASSYEKVFDSSILLQCRC